MNPQAPSNPPPTPEPTPSEGPPTYRSQDLFMGHGQVNILHKDMRYTLRETREGKLILTK